MLCLADPGAVREALAFALITTSGAASMRRLAWLKSGREMQATF
jgi:hypothetical protein